jgi:hypothetical protein
MYSISLNDNGQDFKTIEKEIFKIVCEVGCNIISEILEQLDLTLMATRDTDTYRNKGVRKSHIHTVMGTVEYSRRVYECKDEEGRKKYVRLLDKYLKNEVIGCVSTNLAEKVIERVMEEPYRKATEAIASISNEKLSHMAIWNITQKVGAKLAKQQEEKVKRYNQGRMNGTREVDVLFQEADGIWLSMQGEDRPKGGHGKRELKLAISYDGWIKRSTGATGYEVINKKACAGFCDSKSFKSLWDASIAEEYNIDEIEVKILNGDGAKWIKEGLGEEGVHFQLDPFHVAQAIVRNVPDKKEAGKLMKMFKQGSTEEGFEYLTELLIKYNQDEKCMKKLETLYNYLTSNREGLKPYHLRGLDLPKPPEGVEYRHLGTMEHNICDIIATRMKGRKMSWSTSGANHLAKLLAERASKTLYQRLSELMQSDVSSNWLEEITEVIQFSAAEVNKNTRKSKVYKVHKGAMPFEGQPLTEGMKVIRDLVKDRASSELIYR